LRIGITPLPFGPVCARWFAPRVDDRQRQPGLVNEVVPTEDLESRTRKVARVLAGTNPHTLRRAKI
jgi:1,4-dihydroxy-2-naphthoyl-CoA synthase